MAAWSHLPNTAHIDRVLNDLEQAPTDWAAAWDAAWAAAWDAAWTTARDATVVQAAYATRHAAQAAARAAARGAAWAAARGAAWDAAWGAAWGTARGAAWGTARDAVSALVAYDDCAHLLNQTPEFVRGHINLTDDPAAILLLPAVIAMQGSRHGIPI